ncbi:MAG TPA: OmpA family protein [Myxococcota bacterium]|nr:OmpA family protein [Myxococcota bacterium]
MFWILPLALAQDVVTLSVVKTGQVGTSVPSLKISLHQEASNLAVDLSCGSKKFTRSGAAALGAVIELPLDVPAGTWSCKGSLVGSFADGSEGEMPLSFTVAMLNPMKVSLETGSLDLERRSLRVVLDRKASKVEVSATTLGGDVVGLGEVQSTAGAGTPISVSWEKMREGEIIKVRIRAFDADGFWSELELLPWSYRIPHEDLNFPTASAEILTTEEPKLEEALARVQETLRKYGQDLVTIRLYVGGHTDTMGDSAYNQKLSLDRALAIARWFKAHGFPGEVYYQGFGESQPLVSTGDSVDEPRNRRVDYVVASQAPGGGWKPLP